jgi:integrase/recombinase XerD
MTTQEFCQRFLGYCRSTKNLSEHTLRAYTLDLLDFERFIGGDTVLATCDKHLIRRYLRYMREERGLKASTIKRRLACLKVMFNWLEGEGSITTNPIYRLGERIVLPKQLPRTLNRFELGRLLRSWWETLGIKGFGLSKRQLTRLQKTPDFSSVTGFVATELLFATGIRVGELVSIACDDIDLQTGTITIHGKGNRQRRVFLTDSDVIHLIETYLRLRKTRAPNARMFLVNSLGKDASTQFVRKLILRAGELAGIARRITPHMIRHSTATHLLEAGVDIRLVQQLLGHNSISTTQIYTHVSDSNLRSVIGNLSPRRALIKDGMDN